MIEIDGAQGEGGGQILRSSLSLSIITQQPFRITNIRANRNKPGLLRQHLTAVKAAAEICDAEVQGAALGAHELVFKPGKLKAGDYSFAIGTAGSCTLVLQTVLPPLLTAAASSTVRIQGGTHNKAAPPFDFLDRAFLPLLKRMGMDVELTLVSYGFYPRGGGEIRATITPTKKFVPINLLEKGERINAMAEAYIAGLPINIAKRELEVIGNKLNWNEEQLKLRGLSSEVGPGNALTVTVQHEHVTEVFTSFGEKGISSEAVAEQVAKDARSFIASPAAVGEYLADQLLLPLIIAGAGQFTTLTLTPHFQSNALVIEQFTGKRISATSTDGGFLVSL